MPVPPPAYGGTESVIDTLARGLSAAGHEVTLFASGDSTCPVDLRFAIERAPGVHIGGAVVEMQHVIRAYESLSEMDIIHDHTAFGPFYATARYDGPVVTTNHNLFGDPYRTVYESLGGRIPIIAISRHHAATARPLDIAAVIHHGVDPDRFPVGSGAGGYALFLGRLSEDKGAHRAIAIATACGTPIVLAGKMQSAPEIAYFEEMVKPHLRAGVEFVGEVEQATKLELLGNAAFLLNPIAWDEPFGMAMIEALACGTPVLALSYGAASEIIDDARTGFLGATVADLVESVALVPSIDRAECRRAVEGYFSSTRMVNEHVELYNRVLAASPRRRVGSRGR